jgi:hypothetical protein
MKNLIRKNNSEKYLDEKKKKSTDNIDCRGHIWRARSK